MNRSPFVLMLLLLGLGLQASPSFAQQGFLTRAGARALRLLKEADSLERMGELNLAAPAYDRIIKLEDPLGEFPDIRAMAGMRLSVIFLQTGNQQNAKNVLRAILDIPGVSKDLVASAQRALATMP